MNEMPPQTRYVREIPVLRCERTGYVKVTMKDGSSRILRAESFGDAASIVHCGHGEIARFEWVTLREGEMVWTSYALNVPAPLTS